MLVMGLESELIKWSIEYIQFYIYVATFIYHFFLETTCRLWTREEKEIAIVTHSVLLQDTLRMYSKECHPTIRYEMNKR
jgi:hypothetical protein